MTAALEVDEWSAACPGRTLPPGRSWYPFYRRLGGPQVRSGRAENLAPTGIRSPDRLVRSPVAIPIELPDPLSLSIQYIIYVGVCMCLYIYIYHTGSRYSDSLQTGRSGDRIPVGGDFSHLSRPAPVTHPASCTMGTWFFPGVKRPGRGIDHLPHLALLLWAFVASSRVNFIYIYIYIYVCIYI